MTICFGPILALTLLIYHCDHISKQKSISFAERADVPAAVEPRPYALPVKLVLAMQRRNEPTVQALETYTTLTHILIFLMNPLHRVIARLELT